MLSKGTTARKKHNERQEFIMTTTFGHYSLQANGDIWIWKTVDDFNSMNMSPDVHVVLQGDSSEIFMDEVEKHGVDVENYPDADIPSEHIESYFISMV